ncbi:MAG: hypothetical protein ABI609_07280 [Acidobacteriota bacterium]
MSSTTLAQDVRDFFTSPFVDALRGLDQVLAGGAKRLIATGLGLLAGWWLYVPVHELLHAAGCAATGGEVHRLEIAPLYGGAALAKFLPFVSAGGEYAGRLSGFDTQGSDLTYLATDFAPFILTLFPGVWLLRRAARAEQAWLFGVALPLALAPIVSLTGDAYEIGSIVVTHLAPWRAATDLRGDDLFVLVRTVLANPSTFSWLGLALSQLVGLIWALATCGLGSWIASRLGQRRLPQTFSATS